MLTKLERQVIKDFLEAEFGSEEMHEAIAVLIDLYEANNLKKGGNK